MRRARRTDTGTNRGGPVSKGDERMHLMNFGLNRARFAVAVAILGALTACRVGEGVPAAPPMARQEDVKTGAVPLPRNAAGVRVAHVYVALCDNQNQGIVPVPAAIGNGDDADRNLYWGAAFGVRTTFSKNRDWKLVSRGPGPGEAVVERCVFEHARRPIYLVADAYRGSEIRRATLEFLEAAAGRRADVARIGAQTLYAGGSSNLVAYVGHDGLMEFNVPDPPSPVDSEQRDAVILACASKQYFADKLRPTGAMPLLWTTGLMAPEAYVLEAALEGWAAGEPGVSVRSRAAAAYNRYQNCGLHAAERLFATGW